MPFRLDTLWPPSISENNIPFSNPPCFSSYLANPSLLPGLRFHVLPRIYGTVGISLVYFTRCRVFFTL